MMGALVYGFLCGFLGVFGAPVPAWLTRWLMPPPAAPPRALGGGPLGLPVAPLVAVPVHAIVPLDAYGLGFTEEDVITKGPRTMATETSIIHRCDAPGCSSTTTDDKINMAGTRADAGGCAPWLSVRVGYLPDYLARADRNILLACSKECLRKVVVLAAERIPERQIDNGVPLAERPVSP